MIKYLLVLSFTILLSCFGNGSEIGNPAVVTGNLIDAGSHPAAGVKLSLFKKSYIPGDSIPSGSTSFSDSNGNYSIPFTDTGIYNLVGESEMGYVFIPNIEVIDSNSVQVKTDTVLPPGSITGTVSTTLSSEKVRIYMPGTSYITTLKQDGTYSFPLVAKGTYTIVINSDSTTLPVTGITVKSADSTTIDNIYFSDSIIPTINNQTDILIDDFENSQVNTSSQKWYYSDDSSAGGNSIILNSPKINGIYPFSPAPDIGYSNSNGAMLRYDLGDIKPVGCSGQCEYGQFVAMGVTVTDTSRLSLVTDLTFMGKASSPMNIYLNVKTSAVKDSGWFNKTLQFTEQWNQFSVSLSDLVQYTWAVEELFDPSTITGFEWVITADILAPDTGYIVIDNIYLRY